MQGWVYYPGFSCPLCWLIGTIVVGVILYWVRVKHRVWYGFGEIIVSIGLMYAVYFSHGGAAARIEGGPSPTLLDRITVKGLPLVIIVYLFVRGCDNLCEGLRHP